MLLSSITAKDIVLLDSAEYIGKPVGIILNTGSPVGKYPIITDAMRIFTYDDMFANDDIITVNSALNSIPHGTIIKLGDKLYSVQGKYAGICKDIHMQKSGARIITENAKIPCSKIVASSDGLILYNPKYRAPKVVVELPEAGLTTLPATIDTAITEVAEPKDSDYAFMLGKRLKNEVSDIGRSFVLMAGTIITERVIQNARRAGKLTDLYNNVK